MLKPFWLILPFIIIIPLISFFSLRFIGGFGIRSGWSRTETLNSGLRTQDSKRDVLLEALNKSKHGLSDMELKGEEYYKHYCSICHGSEGRGDGFNAYNLNPRPKNFAEIIPSMDDRYLYKVISEGTTSVGKSALCPPRGLYLEHDAIEAIISYLRKVNR